MLKIIRQQSREAILGFNEEVEMVTTNLTICVRPSYQVIQYVNRPLQISWQYIRISIYREPFRAHLGTAGSFTMRT